MVNRYYTDFPHSGFPRWRDAMQIVASLHPSNAWSTPSDTYAGQLPRSRLEELLDYSLRANLAPFYFASVLRHIGLDLPEAVARPLHLESLLWSAKRDVIADITARLNGAGIEFVFLKGIDSRSSLPRWMIRPQADIDVLVRPSDLSDTEELFANIGFKRVYDETLGLSRQRYEASREKYFTHRGDMLRSSASDIPIKAEVHFRMHRIPEPYLLRADSVIKDHVSRVFESLVYPAPSASDHIQFMSVHMYRHDTELNSIRIKGDHLLSRVIDIAFYLLKHRTHIDFDKVLEVSKKRHIADPVIYSLSIVDQLFPHVIPEQVKQRISHRCIVAGNAIRHTVYTGDYTPIAHWKAVPVCRIFDPSRYREVLTIEEQLRRKPLILQDPDLAFAYRKADQIRLS